MKPKQAFTCGEQLTGGQECQLTTPHRHLPPEVINAFTGQVTRLAVSLEVQELAEQIRRSYDGRIDHE